MLLIIAQDIKKTKKQFMESETLKISNPANTAQRINLIDGYFTATEAYDIINSILNLKINFHKLHRLSITERNTNDLCEFDNNRINELLAEQETAKDFFKNVKCKKLKINSSINIAIEE